MGIRITQQYMYQNMITGMQGSLGRYMNAMEAGSSQKAVNRPSDDPAAMYRILMSRNDINDTKQYLTNINTAKGWLSLTDDVLSSQLTTTIRRLIALAEQASTGTYNRDQREQMSYEARELFGQVLNLSNTEHNGSSIFAGHKYDANAYEQGLALTRPQKGEWKGWDDAIANGEISVHGASKTSVAIQFIAEGTVGDVFPMNFVWSNDGGKTWKDGTLAAGSTTLAIAEIGIQVDLKKGLAVHAPADPDSHETDDGMFFLHPAAFYQGDAGDPPPVVTVGGVNAAAGATKATATAAGVFGGNVLVRVEGIPTAIGGHDPVDFKRAGDVFDYAYSTDNGTTWIRAKAATTGSDIVRLPVPGGYISIDSNSVDDANTLSKWATGAPAQPVQLQFLEDDGVNWTYRWTNDGGASWTEKTVANTLPITITEGGATFTFDNPPTATARDAEPVQIQFLEDDGANWKYRWTKDGGESWLEGSVANTLPITITEGGTSFSFAAAPAPVDANAGPVQLQFLEDDGANWRYRWTNNGGASWTEGTVPNTLPFTIAEGGAFFSFVAAPIPIDADTGTVAAGAEFLIHPDRANLGYEIMQGAYVDVNNVGKEIFGGYYYRDQDGRRIQPVPAHYDERGNPLSAMDDDTNLFKVVGEFVTALEFNSQEGCQQALARLNKSLAHVTTQAARIGGLENRVSLAYDVQTANRLAQEEVLSSTEDIDLTELLTKLTQYQSTYQTVLLSTSKIMNLSLANYI